MFDKLSKTLVKLFGSRSQRVVKSYMHAAEQAGEFVEQVKALDPEALHELVLSQVLILKHVLSQIEEVGLTVLSADPEDNKTVPFTTTREWEVMRGVLREVLHMDARSTFKEVGSEER